MNVLTYPPINLLPYGGRIECNATQNLAIFLKCPNEIGVSECRLILDDLFESGSMYRTKSCGIQVG